MRGKGRAGTGWGAALTQTHLGSVAPADRPFFLVAGFPPKPLSDTSATLKDADVLGSAVTQRLQ